MSPIIGIMASANWSSANASSFESIATATGTGSSATITLSSIPSTYQHLQIRINYLVTTNGNYSYLRLNGDTGSNYARHMLYGDGASVVASGGAPQTTMLVNSGQIATLLFTNYANCAIIDIHNYSSTTQNKTVRILNGVDANGSGNINLNSGLWMNTAAVNSITFYAGQNFSTSTSIALYGIK